jgi:AcrR family transcriptional regulator
VRTYRQLIPCRTQSSLLLLHIFARSAILQIRQIYESIASVSNSDTQTDVGLRERKRRETRAALSLAGLRLCFQRGWENVTVDDIAADANVSPRTFRNYFSTKAEAVAAGHLERLLRVADELRTRPASEPIWTAIANSVAAQFQPPVQKSEALADAKRWQERIRFVLTEPAIQGEVLKAAAAAQVELAEAIAERSGAPRGKDLHSQVMAAVAVAIIGTVMDRWLRDGPSGPILPLLCEAFRLAAAGFSEAKAKARA